MSNGVSNAAQIKSVEISPVPTPASKRDVVDFLWHVSPALITVFCGTIIGSIIIQRFFVSRANQASHIDRLVKELDDLRGDALEYWATTGKEESAKARLLEQKLKGHIMNLSSELQMFVRRYRKTDSFVEPMMEVADACTGGAFESKKRGPEPNRYISIIKSINAVKNELLSGKL